jgi:hypothetical protein
MNDTPTSKEPTRGVGEEAGGATVALDRGSAEAGAHIPLSPDSLSVEAQRELAEQLFPQQWAWALMLTGGGSAPSTRPN